MNYKKLGPFVGELVDKLKLLMDWNLGWIEHGGEFFIYLFFNVFTVLGVIIKLEYHPFHTSTILVLRSKYMWKNN